MGVVGWTWLVVAASFALYLGVALYTGARSAADYYVADRPVSPVLNGMATATDWMSAATFMSMAGLIAVMGRAGSAYLMVWTGGSVLLAVLLAPYLRTSGTYPANSTRAARAAARATAGTGAPTTTSRASGASRRTNGQIAFRKNSKPSTLGSWRSHPMKISVAGSLAGAGSWL